MAADIPEVETELFYNFKMEMLFGNATESIESLIVR